MENNHNQAFELSEKNILEEFYELIEKHQLDSANNFALGDFYDYLSDFDLSYQKFNTQREGQRAVKYTEKWLNQTLYVFLTLFKIRGFSDRPLFYSFKRYIHWFSLVLEANQKLNSEFFFKKNITENFPSFMHSDYLEFLNNKIINFNILRPEQFDEYYELFETVEHEIARDLGLVEDNKSNQFKTKLNIFGDEYSVTEFIINNENEEFKKKNIFYEMTIDLVLSCKENNGSRLITSLNLFINSISNIDNVKVEIESIKTGSLYVRLRIYIKDLLAKEEVKSVIETAKEGVAKILTSGQVSHSEVKKRSAETQKIIAEKEIIEKEIESKPSKIESKFSNALDLERKALKNEQLRIKLIKDKLDLVLKLSDLTTKGILEVDDIKIDINEIMYLIKTGDSINVSNKDIDEIS